MKKVVNYIAQVDQKNKDEWEELLLHFKDTIIYQTWSYGEVRWGKNNLSHLVLKKNDKIVAAAQARIIKFPLIRKGIAYITWGPLWQLRDEERNLENLRQMIRALQKEYVVNRNLFLRVLPSVIDCDKDADTIHSIFNIEGFQWKPSQYRTFLIDLTLSKEQLRKNLSQGWRKQLKKAEKNNLKIIEGCEDKLFEIASKIYNEMLKRKGFVPGIDIKEFRTIQNDLPDNLKMRIMICEFEGEPIASLIGSAIGDKGIELVAGSTAKGLELRASYLLRWRMIEWLKSQNCLCYDLCGINPKRYWGGYQFKAGLAGKRGKDIRHLGQFEAYRHLSSSIILTIIDQIRINEPKVKILLKRIKNKII